MADRPDGKGANPERVTFTRPAAERISRAVLAFEAGDRDAGPLSFGVRLEGDSFKLRLATFTGTWAAGTYKTVTLSGSTQTASVYNWCNAVAGGKTGDTACLRYVIFGKVGGTNSAVEIQTVATCSTCIMSLGGVDLTQVAGYAAGGIQMLGHDADGPCLHWYSVTTCTTAA